MDWILQWKGIECLDGLKKNKLQSYASYKRLTLALRTLIGSIWKNDKRYSIQVDTKEEQV